jgi:hypothetical protein
MNPFNTFANLKPRDSLEYALVEGSNYVVELTKASSDLYRFAPYPTLNPNFWARPLDFSGVSAHIDAQSATLIGESGQFALTASHWYKGIGQTHSFVAEDGTVFVKTVQSVMFGPGAGFGESDIALLKFVETDSVLKKYKLPNPSWYLRTKLANRPLITYSQSNRASAKIWKSNQNFASHATSTFYTRSLSQLPSLYPAQSSDAIIFIRQTNPSVGPYDGPNTVFPNHEVTVLNGDSGKPIFMVLGTELIVMSTFTSYGGGPYHGHPLHTRNIRNMMNTMGGSGEEIFHQGFNV